jgi:hypothetical protein
MAVIVGFFTARAAVAAEGGTTHYLPGAVATIIDLAPTQPGWVIEPIYTKPVQIFGCQ